MKASIYAIAIITTLSATPAFAKKGACDKVGAFSIAPDRFDTVSSSITHASGCTVTTDLSRTGAVSVHGVQGKMTYRQAIAQSVRGSKLKVVGNAPSHLIVR